MSSALIIRRTHLQALAAEQRRALRGALAPLRPPLATADRTLQLLTAVRRQPLWLLLPAAVLLVVRPPRMLPWLQRGWVAWRLLKQIAH